ncbi:MAG: STAS domain-containing protein [Deltaproteobacteria bacterium]|nr:STAS domain-containing protein [Deltaproteobacteria bacterium]
MDIQFSKLNDTTVASVKGRIDASTAPVFEKAFADMMDKGETVFLFDCSELEYISSAGLRIILAAARKLNDRDGKMMFAELRGTVKDVFRISGFGTIFKLYETRDEALADSQ